VALAQQNANQNNLVALDVGARQAVVRIHLLGALRAISYLGEDLVPRGRKARAILGYLCLHAGQRVPRAKIAALLWDRVPDQQARASLRQSLRELLLAFGPLADEVLETDAEMVRLNQRACWVDSAAILAGPHPANLLRTDLAALCEGELLEDLNGVSEAFDEWLLLERARFATEITAVFDEELHQIARADVPAERRAGLARRIIACEPTHEGASRILMAALAELGEKAQALREFERCRMAMRSRLEVEPAAETRALYEKLRSAPTRPKIETGLGPPAHHESRASIAVAAPTASRLRIGVIPFQSTTEDNAQLAFSLSQEIASALARFRWFDVVAALTPQPHLAQWDEAFLRAKGWHYAVEGNLIRGAEKISISIRLLDIGQDIRPVWSDRFELETTMMDQLHDRVVAPVVARIDPAILFIEGKQSAQRRSGATSLVLQALPLLLLLRRDGFERAGELLQQALLQDPQNAKAAAWKALWHVIHIGQGWTDEPLVDRKEAQELAFRAVKNDPESAEAHAVCGHICAFLEKDLESAVHYFAVASRLNPNIAFVWAMSAATYCYLGQPDVALKNLARYKHLASLDPTAHFWDSVFTTAYNLRGNYEEAYRHGRRFVRENPDFSNGYKPLIAALGHLGRREEAAPYVQKLLQLEPHFTIARFIASYPLARQEDRDSYARGLELAGVPKG
jgi:DNA-binding SARP family transcriptional activator/TolB-like protein/Tfp pilus assembly protein PilF